MVQKKKHCSRRVRNQRRICLGRLWRVNWQRRGTAGTSQFTTKFIFSAIVVYAPSSVFCVLFVCKCVLFCCHRVSTKCVLYCCHRVSTKCVLHCCHRVSTKCVLSCCHRVPTKCVLYCCHRVSTKCVLHCCHRLSTKCVLHCCHRVSLRQQLNNNYNKDPLHVSAQHLSVSCPLLHLPPDVAVF
jgi:hypothetical protein